MHERTQLSIIKIDSTPYPKQQVLHKTTENYKKPDVQINFLQFKFNKNYDFSITNSTKTTTKISHIIALKKKQEPNYYKNEKNKKKYQESKLLTKPLKIECSFGYIGIPPHLYT